MHQVRRPDGADERHNRRDAGVPGAHESIEHGLWSARSAEFMQQDTMQTLRWLRIVGDTIFAFGGVALGWFCLGLWTGWSIKKA